ncbi:ImmA/IrrE family metallo-endopeptidase [Curvivirga sp.]|uniref:ImmA/IrrE family metallo-endopeptidase n=1 Tax=Curvivirga sp. TaxID=2856848 RepID=UPI003B5953E8
MNTTSKGNTLETSFYNYLLQQKEDNLLVNGIYPAQLCAIYRKKKYFCSERLNDIEFDIVIELSREGATSPHLIIIFECKNYINSVPESDLTDFSDKLSRIAKHGAKGVLVTNSKLQSGAKNLAEKRKIGIIKFDEQGAKIVAERQNKIANNSNYMYDLLFNKSTSDKSLKFSAFSEGSYFSSTHTFIAALSGQYVCDEKEDNSSVPFIPDDKLQDEANTLLTDSKYISGAVDLRKICSILSIELEYSDKALTQDNGLEVLGLADFENRKIKIFSHNNIHRERFTIAHEIGHFYLKHNKFLSSESVIASDLLIDSSISHEYELNRLEIQANRFAACLLLPLHPFLLEIAQLREDYDIRDTGNGYIYVDNQACNLKDYHNILFRASRTFNVSQQVIEVKLKKFKMLNDQRVSSNSLW